jgi:hypothetical protein
MKKRIKGKLCDTESAVLLGTKYAGKFGDLDGYEEQLYITRSKQHFMYGIGGSDSKYPAATINLLTEFEAEEWKKENNISEKAAPKKAPKTKKKSPVVKKDTTPKKKETAPKIKKTPEKK